MATAMLTKNKLCMSLAIPMTAVAMAKILRVSTDAGNVDTDDDVVVDDDSTTQYCVKGNKAKGNVPRILPKRKLLYKPR